MAKKPMKMDDDDTTDAPIAAAEEPTLIVAGKPVCRKHNAMMTGNGRSGDVDYFRCKVPNCKETAKLARSTEPVPKDPTPCPQRTCEGEFLEVNEALSRGRANLVLVCPKCGFKLNAALPAMVGTGNAYRRANEAAVDDLSVR